MIKQRKRWQKGLISSLRLNKELLFNRRYKEVGWTALPFYTVFEVWGPFIEIIGVGYLIIMAFLAFDFVTPISLWGLGLLLGVTNNLVALTIDKFMLRGIKWQDYGELCAASIAGAVFYHFIQLYCKVKGATEYCFETRVSTVWDTER
jgi:cellulose synthase/poly-beta-1,6-N-acetylglucosamine synthase-like glycosyltransferase